MTTPVLSVLMTAYNREQYISEAIESVLASDFKDFELIIVDDGSKDSTVAIARQYALSDKRIRVYVNEKNLGDYANRNLAASYALGQYIMYVDSDDKTYPWSFEYCLSEMLNDKEVDIGMLCRIPAFKNKILDASASIPYHFFNRQFLIIGPGGTIIKKTFFNKIGKYPTKYGPANDMYFNLKAASLGKVKCLSEEFLYYRMHDGQEANNAYSYLINNYMYMKAALVELPLPLSPKQIKFLKQKMKRRFIMNVFNFYRYGGGIKNSIKAINQTGFNFFDFIEGLFHF